MTTPTRKKVARLLRAHHHECPSCFERLTSLVRHSKHVTLQRDDPQDRRQPTQPLLQVDLPKASKRFYNFLGLSDSLVGHVAAPCPSCQMVWHWSYTNVHKKEGTLALRQRISPSLALLLADTETRKTGNQSTPESQAKRHATVPRTKTSPPQQKWPVDPRDSPPPKEIHFGPTIQNTKRASVPRGRERSKRERSNVETRTSLPSQDSVLGTIRRHAVRFFSPPYEPISRWDTLPEYMPAEDTWSLEAISEENELRSNTPILLVSWQSTRWNQARFEAMKAPMKFHHCKGFKDRDILALKTTCVQVFLCPPGTFKASQDVVLILPDQSKSYLIESA